MRALFLWISVFLLALPAHAQTSAITALVIDDDQNIYLGSGSGVSRMDAENRQMTHILDRVDVQALAWSKRHGVIVGGNHNEIWTTEGRHILSVGDAETRITAMMISGASLWVGTTQGAYVVSLTREEVSAHHTADNSDLPHNEINTMYADGSGIKWIGTESGVVRIEGEKKWRSYEEGTRFLAIAGNVEGAWLAGDREMWLVDPFNRWTPTDVNDGLSSGEIRSVATDRQGRIYLLSDIFIQFNPYTDEIIPIDDQSPGTVAQNVALAVDKDDQLWVATRDDGIRMIDPEVELAERPLAATLVLTHPSCAGMQNGAIDVQVQGGRPPYDFLWVDRDLNGPKATNLAGGEYRIIVSDGQNNTYEDRVTLQEPVPLNASVTREETAEGIALIAQATGGRGDLTYVWNTGGQQRKLAVESEGTYLVTVTDVNGCTAVASFVVEPDVFATAEVEPEPEPVEQDDAIESDTEEEVLRELDAKSLNVGQVLRIEQLQFQADSSAIRPESFAVLDGITAFLLRNENIMIEIGGHTNGLPDHDYCDRLSRDRARSVAEYLSTSGVPARRITYHGYGKRQPVATNETVEGRRKNQRVEIKILEM